MNDKFIMKSLTNFIDYFFWSSAIRLPFCNSGKINCDFGAKILPNYEKRINSILSEHNYKSNIFYDLSEELYDKFLKLADMMYGYSSYFVTIFDCWTIATQKHIVPTIVVHKELFLSHKYICQDMRVAIPKEDLNLHYCFPTIFYRYRNGGIVASEFFLSDERRFLRHNIPSPNHKNLAIKYMSEVSRPANVKLLNDFNEKLQVNYNRSFIVSDEEE